MPVPDRTASEPLALPRHPPPPAKPAFPLLAVLAPLVGAAVLYAIVRSPIMLAFAALSPVIAVASAIDGRLSARRRRRTDARAFAAEAARFLADVAEAHERERAELGARHPTARSLATDPAQRPRRWSAGADRFAAVRIGTGSTRSALVVSGAPNSERDRELLAAARVLEHAPVLIDPAGGIGLIGLPVMARAVLRGFVAQLAHAHAPGAMTITAPPGEPYDWLHDYPHAIELQHELLRLRIVDQVVEGGDERVPAAVIAAKAPRRGAAPLGAGPPATAVIAVAERADELPTACHFVASVGPDGTLTVLSPIDSAGELQAELVTAREAAAFGRDLAAAARTRGIDPGRPLPTSVHLADLLTGTGGGLAEAVSSDESRTLPAIVGIAPSGPLVLDLVASGPHAIVTGTTGSGKSELLISWVLAMAAAAPPRLANFLLVDFKGGSAFQRLAALPHTVGVVTDLAHGEASRALKSLRAELRRREAELARLGISDIAAAQGELPRLVIVVDEAAAMLAAFPELAQLFADIAARGRALGIHLVLGTQRATGVLSDALVANCALRVSLRLASDSDSTALLGTDAAALIPHGLPGRLVVSRDGELITAQAATADPNDVDAVASAQSRGPRPRAPWLPALPEHIPLDAFVPPPEGAIVIGARDDPDRQVQEGILYRPQRAHLLVLGVRGTGKSSLLRTIRVQWPGPVIQVPADIEGAWDALEHAYSVLHSGPARSGLVVLIDDVDALLERFGDEYRDAAAERIRSLLVDGARAGIGVVCTASVMPSGLRATQGRFGERLLLRQPDRQEHVLLGAPAELFDSSAPPGRGVWRDKVAQVAVAGELRDDGHGVPLPASPPALEFTPGSLTLIVARAPGSVAQRLRASVAELSVAELPDVIGTPSSPGRSSDSAALEVADGGRAMAIVADPDAWQAQWSLLTRLRGRARLVFDGCSLAQVRAILHTRVLPPATEPGHLLVCDAAAEFTRATRPE